MIQRIQTVYLLIAAILTGMLSLLPLAHGITADTTLCAVSIWGFTAPTPDSYSGSWLNLAAVAKKAVQYFVRIADFVVCSRVGLPDPYRLTFQRL